MATNLTLSDVFTPASQSTWFSTLIGAATSLNLPATSWQSGAIARTLVAVMSYAFAGEDGLISMAAQGGFLDFAGTGTVSVTNPITGAVTTVPVTVDPSTLTGAALAAWNPGWLDILADGSYNCQRVAATNATNGVAITNAVASSYGPFAAGTYHIANPTTGASYSNVSALTIGAASFVGGAITAATNTSPVTVTTTVAHGLTAGQTVTIAGVTGNTGANGTYLVGTVGANTITLLGSIGSGAYVSGGTVDVCTVAQFVADVAGSGSTSGVGGVTQPVTSLVGVSVYNTAPIVGSSYESNAALVNRCRLKLQSFSPNGPNGAYAFVALTSSQMLAALPTPQFLAGGTITRALVLATGGTVTTYVANSGSGTVAGVAGLQVTGATNASPIVLTVPSTAGVGNGMTVFVSGVAGNVAANGYWIASAVTGTTITLSNSVGNGAYTSGGSVEAGDVGLVDSLIQSSVVPAGTTATTVSAGATAAAIVATVYVPAAQVSAYTSAYAVAFANYFSTFPIGGLNTDGTLNVLPYGAVEGLLYEAGTIAGSSTSYVRSVTALTVNGSTADVSVGATNVITPSYAITVIGQ